MSVKSVKTVALAGGGEITNAGKKGVSCVLGVPGAECRALGAPAVEPRLCPRRFVDHSEKLDHV